MQRRFRVFEKSVKITENDPCIIRIQDIEIAAQNQKRPSTDIEIKADNLLEKLMRTTYKQYCTTHSCTHTIRAKTIKLLFSTTCTYVHILYV